MLLTIDRGNTKDKFAVFDGEGIILDSDHQKWLEFLTISSLSDTIIEDANKRTDMPKILFDNNIFLSEFSKFFSDNNFIISDCIFCSVRDEATNKDFLQSISKYFPSSQLTIQTPLPIKNMYKAKSLGMDRLAAIIGARDLFGNNVLVIDAGTCLTFDYLDESDCYLGGSISPGIQMKYESLHNFTDNLPLINDTRQVNLIGNATDTSIRSGVLNGTIGEIKQTINHYREKFSGIKVVMTGGDSKFIKSFLDTDIKIEKNLIFRGLKKIFEFNEKNIN